MRRGLILPAVGAVALFSGAAIGPIHAFDRLEPGEWQLRTLDSAAAPQRLCVHDGYDLIQLRHPGAGCARFVLNNEPQSATVHYTCSGSGYGRTTLRVETGQLVRIDSQGLVNRAPFEMSLEGRRIGNCAGEAPAVR